MEQTYAIEIIQPSVLDGLTVADNVIELSDVGIIGLDSICRLCACRSDHLIPIFDGEGAEHQLAMKINRHFPFTVDRDDALPSHCCYQCASTLLNWHDLLETSVEADKRLKALQVDAVLQLNQKLENLNEQNDKSTTDETNNAAVNIIVPTTTSPSSPPPIVLSTEQRLTQSHVSPVASPRQTSDRVKQENDEAIKCELEDDVCVKQEPEFDSEQDTTLSVANNDNEDSVGQQTDLLKEECFEDTKSSLCIFCGDVFNSYAELRQHKRIAKHSIRKSSRIKANREELARVRIEVDQRVYYRCAECGKNLHSPYTYMSHMRIHTGERLFVCDLCGKQFRVSQGLVRHLRETHAGVKKHSCDICGRAFASRRNTEEHRRIHTNERPYVCAMCGKTFKQKASLFIHSRSHSASFSYKCPHCDQAFHVRSALLTHVTKHTGVKPFACDICDRRFRIKYDLKQHRLVHSDEKPFKCNECGIAFRQKRYLRNHNRNTHPAT